MKKTLIAEQEFKITNPVDHDLATQSIKSQLGSKVFEQLIKDEKEALILEVKIYVQEDEKEEVKTLHCPKCPNCENSQGFPYPCKEKHRLMRSGDPLYHQQVFYHCEGARVNTEV